MKIILLIVITAFTLYAQEIKVAVAANVGYSLNSLINSFNTLYPKIKIVPTLASSGSLTAQILNNAPYDIFISADLSYPKKIYAQNLAKLPPKVYAKGLLTLVSNRPIPNKTLDFLANKSIKTIAIANPKLAPYGKATIEALEKAQLLQKVKSKFIYAQSISQTLAFALNGTDVGFVAKSSLNSKNIATLKNKIYWKDINNTFYSPIEQGAITLKNASSHSQLFYDFLFSKKAQDIFIRYGYLIDQ